MLVKLVISLTRKILTFPFEYKVFRSVINRTDTVKDQGIILDTEIYFQHHVVYIFLQPPNFCVVFCITEI